MMTDGTTVSQVAHDVLNQVLEQQILNVQIETGEVLDLETGQDVIIQNLGDVAIYVNESNQIINSSIGSLNTAFSNLENTLVDLTTGVSDVYVQATPPVAGVGEVFLILYLPSHDGTIRMIATNRTTGLAQNG
jgi:hypothetical protein